MNRSRSSARRHGPNSRFWWRRSPPPPTRSPLRRSNRRRSSWSARSSATGTRSIGWGVSADKGKGLSMAIKGEKKPGGELLRNARERTIIEDRWEVVGNGSPPRTKKRKYKYVD